MSLGEPCTGKDGGQLISLRLPLKSLPHSPSQRQGACLYHLSATITPAAETWITAYGLQLASPGDRYLIALYWSVMTITTIGFGDVPPQTNSEIGFSVLCMFLGGAIYAYVIGNICGLISSMDEAR